MSVATPQPSAQAAESPFLPRIARIVAAEQFTEKEKGFRLVLQDGKPLNHLPLSFVEVSVFGVGEAPISICSSPTQEQAFELCVRNVGSVTNAMHELDTGDTLGIRGPFGNGFDADEHQGEDFLFVAGGLGLAPARSLIQYVLDKRSNYGRVTILLGARTPGDLLFQRDIKEWVSRPDVETHVTVDRPAEGWDGNVGVITTLFKKITINPSKTMAVIIGPPVMFKFAVLEALASGIPESRCICSLERRMKCGLGWCGHCQIRDVYVCKEGPVFTYEQVKKLREGI
ncbi:MAG: FAD/NAD(P)-binding protein [Candidatus Brocadiia bacterium]